MDWSISLKRTGKVCISATGQLELTMAHRCVAKEINKSLEFMIYAMWELEYGITG